MERGIQSRGNSSGAVSPLLREQRDQEMKPPDAPRSQKKKVSAFLTNEFWDCNKFNSTEINATWIRLDTPSF